MDLLTHAVLGAAVSTVVASRFSRRTEANEKPPPTSRLIVGVGVGAFAGVLPDLDAVIQSGSDALLVLDYHRHFTHALAFVPLGGLVAAMLMWPLLRRKISFVQLYVLSLCAYLSHLLLDACTSYGTHLWLPFSSQTSAWNLVAVVDPVFTLLLLIPLILAWRKGWASVAQWGLLLALGYLGLAGIQQHRVEGAALTVAQSRGHTPMQLVVKPTMGNILLWRVLYVHEQRVYADAVQAGVSVRHYGGQSTALLDVAQATLLAAGDAGRLRDIERFRVFSDGLLVLDPASPGFVGDVRYAMLPTSVTPIWGIQWAGEGAATDFVSRHQFPAANRSAFLAMLFGRPLPAVVQAPLSSLNSR